MLVLLAASTAPHIVRHLGWLPELPDDAPTPSPRPCFWCNGIGKIDDGYHDRLVPCDACGGSGVRVDRRLAGAPAVEIVAQAA
jgi:hypothetical protein